MALAFSDLYAGFPPPARILLTRYVAHWRISAIEDLLRIGGGPVGPFYTHIIPRDICGIIAGYVQESHNVTADDVVSGRSFTVCGFLHRFGDGPAIDSRNLTSWSQYGVSHRDGGAIATFRRKDNCQHSLWTIYGEPTRPYNLPTQVTINRAGTVTSYEAMWPVKDGRLNQVQYIMGSEHVKRLSLGGYMFTVTTDLITGGCTLDAVYF